MAILTDGLCNDTAQNAQFLVSTLALLFQVLLNTISINGTKYNLFNITFLFFGERCILRSQCRSAYLGWKEYRGCNVYFNFSDFWYLVPQNILVMKIKLVLDAKAQLGEGAIWHTATQLLFWVDIEGKKLHQYHPASGKTRTIDLPERIGTVVLAEESKAVIALQNGIFELDVESEALTPIANPLRGMPDMRFNDGKCDPVGRLWVGSMHLSAQPKEAALYRLEADGTIERVLDDITISNGIAWSLNHRTMYYIDTPTGCVQAFDYESSTGHITNPRVVITVPEGEGYPDGMTIDEEGMLWVAHWGGSQVVRWNPETGKMLQKIEVPAPHVTSCAFGGDDLATLYITTAREGLDDEQLETYPQSGGLFAVEPGVKGIPAYLFGNTIER